MKPSKILVPVDFSPFSDYATDYSIFLSQKYNSQISLFHVIVLYEADVDEEAHVKQLEEIIKRKEENTNELFERHRQKFLTKSLEIDSEITRGISPANTILEYIDEHKFDLVLMGTHGRTGIKNWIYGSVTEKVVRLSKIPVMTIHSNPKSIQIDKILVPVDFSENSREGVKEAIKIAKDFEADIDFIHVVEQHLQTSFHVVGIESIYATNPDLKKITGSKLQEFCNCNDIEASYTVIEGTAHQTIADYSKDSGADLIVMSTRGYTGLDHLLIGSTTERVVRTASCPVLTVGRHRKD
ncbi:MAG: universal stress protein [Calditrichaeota bacterium]|nr:MAG: universal stress protein [Calditrichota bacterium]MBL1207104.1 universal stress protein [Calditrichota bacterium]NOG46934.1 universal stress protein [Calditrichota bacterium]